MTAEQAYGMVLFRWTEQKEIQAPGAEPVFLFYAGIHLMTRGGPAMNGKFFVRPVHYSKDPYWLIASSTVIEPIPTR